MTNVRKLSIRERFGHLAKKPDRDEAERQRRAAEFAETKKFLEGTHLHDAQAGADAIIAAGRKRRGEFTEFERGPPPFEAVKTTAADIVKAAAKARGETVDEPEPMRADVAAIVAAGAKRRGEAET